MSYSGLGQAKIVAGQINFSTLPRGATSLPSLEPLVRAGLPIAPYIEHGSWETGQPDIMRYGLDPYRGLMGTEENIVRRLKGNQEYVVHCDGWAQLGNGHGGRHVRGLEAALRTAKRELSAPSNRHDTCRIYLPKRAGMYVSGEELAAVRLRRGGGFEIRFRPQVRPMPQQGMGQLLTDWACDQTAYARAWRERLGMALDAGAQSALVGGVVAGLIGAATKNLVAGVLGGAAAGWTAHTVWTATHRAS